MKLPKELPTSKLTAQTILGLVMVALSAGVTAGANGITLEAGPVAGIVGGLVSLLLGLGYYTADNRVSSSARRTIAKESGRAQTSRRPGE